jgi:parallel beta helix pectate lyase-like protein
MPPRSTVIRGVLTSSLLLVVVMAPGARADDPAPHDQVAAQRARVLEAERQADLVASEDQRLMEAQLAAQPSEKHPKGASEPYRVRSSGNFTLVLTRKKDPYTFDDLRRLAPETLLPRGDNTFLLRENILVAPGATLNIAPRSPLRLRMSSGPGGFVSLVTQGGRLRLSGTESAPITISSWDESRGRKDTDVTDGRAYVRASGQLDVEHTRFEGLGFWSGRTGGVSVVGTGSQFGGSLVQPDEKGEPEVEHGDSGTELLPAGKLPSAAQTPDGSYSTRISDSTMTGNAFGLFLTGTSGPQITATTIKDSVVDGLVLHRDVDSATVTDVRIEGSGEDGVVIARRVEGTVLTRLEVTRNGQDGVVLAGKPLAAGPSASGSSTRAFGNNVLTASNATANGRIGIHVIGGTAVRVQGNTVDGGRSGIVVSDGASDVEVDSNRIINASGNGIQVRESSAVAVTANVVRNSPTGVHIRNSAASVRQNSTAGVSLHGITFVGRVRGSVADENLLAGSGTSPIDQVRVTGEQGPTLSKNDVSGWKRTVTTDSLVSVLMHPLTVIWMVIAVLLLAMSRPRRNPASLPYNVDPLVAQAHADAQAHAAAVAQARARALALAPPARPAVLTIPEQVPGVIDLAVAESLEAGSGGRRRRRVST